MSLDVNTRVSNKKTLLAFGLATTIILAFIGYGYFSGKIPDFFLGEEFFILHHAVNYTHVEAWWQYFLQNGRLLEGVYWTYLYEILDYSPALIRVTSYLLYYIIASLATYILIRIWPHKKTIPFIAFCVPLLIFFNPHAINWATRLSGDNSRLAFILFLIATIFLQQWAANQRKAVYLVCAFALHLMAVFTYESTMFLMPAGFLLALPLIDKNELNEKPKEILLRLIGFSFASMFFVLIPYIVYIAMKSIPGIYNMHPSVSKGLLPIGEMLVSSIPNFFRDLVNVGNSNTFYRGPVILVIYLLVIVFVLIRLIQKQKKNQSEEYAFGMEHKIFVYVSVFAAALWILVFGMYPYALIGTDLPSSRIFVTALMGFPLVLILAYELTPRFLWRTFIVGAMFMWFGMAYSEFESRSEFVHGHEAFYNTFYTSLVEVVPQVKSETTFVWYDFDFFKWGCAPSLMMLYQTRDLQCAWFSSTNNRYVVDRYDIQINAHQGGWIRNENIIIIGINDDGTAYIIPEITQDDNLLINWFSNKPIQTDYRRIVLDSSEIPSPMLRSLLKRQAILNAK